MKEIRKNIFISHRNNKKQDLFEGGIPLQNGMSYNSYLINDEKTILLDTVDVSVKEGFIDDLKSVLKNKDLDYLLVQHMEPDHSALICEVVKAFPEVQIITSFLGKRMIFNFNRELKLNKEIKVIKDGDKLVLGEHTLHFISAPMVHWPEVMVTFEETENILFSADAFGTFGSFDELDSKDVINPLNEERRYYTNIVGKYGPQVQDLLAKVKCKQLSLVCPVHGPIHSTRISEVCTYYDKWSRYEAENKSNILIVFTSIYGHTRNAAHFLKEEFEKNGVCSELCDLNSLDIHEALSKIFIYKKIVLMAPSFNMGVFVPMLNYLEIITAHNIENKVFSIIENGSWAPSAGRVMKEYLNKLKNCNLYPKVITITSSLSKQNKEEFIDLVKNF